MNIRRNLWSVALTKKTIESFKGTRRIFYLFHLWLYLTAYLAQILSIKQICNIEHIQMQLYVTSDILADMEYILIVIYIIYVSMESSVSYIYGTLQIL